MPTSRERPASSWVLPFEDGAARDPAVGGGKGAALASLLAEGFQVPTGFVVTPDAFQAFLEHHGLEAGVKKALASERQAQRFADQVLTAPVPESLALALEKAFKALGAARVAVRSSCVFEDGASRSWAGQFESVLNVPKAGLLDALKRCWASRFNARVLAYRAAQTPGRGVGMAVVVQQLIDSDVAGVGFSLHPVTGDSGQIVLEAARGLGEALVAGKVTPERYVFAKKALKVLEHAPARQTEILRSAAKGGTQWGTVKPSGKTLEPAQARAVAKLVLELERHAGRPVDVEWAVARRKLFLLQCRPVTT